LVKDRMIRERRSKGKQVKRIRGKTEKGE